MPKSGLLKKANAEVEGEPSKALINNSSEMANRGVGLIVPF